MDAELPITAPAAEQVAAGELQRSHVREDGTLVIDILAKPPCGTGGDGEIVVCAPGQSPYRYDPAPEPPPAQVPRAELQVGENTTVRARAETEPRSGAERLMIDVVYKF